MSNSSIYSKLIKEFKAADKVFEGNQDNFKKNYSKWFNPMFTKTISELCLSLKRDFIDLYAKFSSRIDTIKWKEVKSEDDQLEYDNLCIRLSDIENRLLILDTYNNNITNYSSVNNTRFAIIIASISLFLGILSLLLGIISFSDIIKKDNKKEEITSPIIEQDQEFTAPIDTVTIKTSDQ